MGHRPVHTRIAARERSPILSRRLHGNGNGSGNRVIRRLVLLLTAFRRLFILRGGGGGGVASALPSPEPPPTPNCPSVSSPSDNYEDNTARIQGALDRYSCVSVLAAPSSPPSKGGEGGGGGGGDYPISSLSLPSHSSLYLGGGVRLMAVIGITRRSLVLLEGVTNVTISGAGMLYGSAEDAASYYDEYDNRFEPAYPDGSPWRPNNLLISNSEYVAVRGISLHNASDWTFRMDNSSHIFVDSVDIYGDSRFPNNDGFDPQSCRNVTLVNSRIDVADDGICPKARRGMGPLDGLVVRNCTIRSKSHAIKFGSNTDEDMRNCLFDDITVEDSNSGLSIQQRSAGDIRNVTFSNIRIETRYEAGRWWGNGEWLSVTRIPRRPDDVVGIVDGLHLVNITARSENGGLLSGYPNRGILRASFRNVSVHIETWSNYSVGPQPCCAVARTGHPSFGVGGRTPPPHSSTTFGTRRGGSNCTEISCLGSRDYRPVMASAVPPDCPRGHERVPARADGIFAEHVRELLLEDVAISFASPRKSWFGDCVVVDDDTIGGNVRGRDSVRCIHGPGGRNRGDVVSSRRRRRRR